MTQYKKTPLRSSGPPIPCKICGEKSNGVHYGVMTCEGCKSFFKRELAKATPKTYLCFRGDACYAEEKAKGRCRACRYKKCLQEGMSSHHLLSQGSSSKTAVEKCTSRLLSKSLGSALQNHNPEPPEKGCEGKPESHPDLKRRPFLPSTSSGDGSTGPSSDPTVGSFPFRRTVLVDGRTQKPLQGILEKSLSAPDHPHLSSAAVPWLRRIYEPNWVLGRPEVKEFVTKFDLDQLNNCPPNLRDYFHAIIMQNRCLEDTVRAVVDAGDMADSERRRQWLEHTRQSHSSVGESTLVCSFKEEHQTRISTEALRKTLRFEFQLGVNWSRDFICGLPGLTDLTTSDLTRLLVERSFQFFVINLASLFSGNEALNCDTSRRTHCSSQLPELLSNRDLPEFLDVVNAELGQLHLSHTERYLLLILLLLDPETAPEEKKLLFSFLHTLYLDALLQLLHHGRAGLHSGPVSEKVRRLLRRFTQVASIGREYFTALNLDATPHDKEFYSKFKTGKIPDNTNVFLLYWTNLRDARSEPAH